MAAAAAETDTAAAAAAVVDTAAAAADVADIRETGCTCLVAEVPTVELEKVLAAVLVLPKNLRPEHYSSS